MLGKIKYSIPKTQEVEYVFVSTHQSQKYMDLHILCCIFLPGGHGRQSISLFPGASSGLTNVPFGQCLHGVSSLFGRTSW